MSDVRFINDLARAMHGGGGLSSGGQPPDNGDMERRIAELEAFAREARERLTRIDATMATKIDVGELRTELHKSLNDQTWRIVGVLVTFGTLLAAAVFYIARNVH